MLPEKPREKSVVTPGDDHAAPEAAALGPPRLLQDFMLPVDKVPAFVETLDRTMGLWPLWFCPLRNIPAPARSNPPTPDPYPTPPPTPWRRLPRGMVE